MSYLKPDEIKKKEELDGMQELLNANRNSPAYNIIFKFIQLQLDVTKNKMLDSQGDDLIQLKGEAVALRNLVRILTNPARPSR